jgi:CubicO group peptidase (beta-lactamase class C family)
VNISGRELSSLIETQQDPEPFSGVVRVSRGDEVLFEEARGLALHSEMIPITTQTRFQMASGCKIFTAVAVLQLVQAGKLSLDTLLTECVEDRFPRYDPGITIRHLLTHSSGITSYFEEDVDPDYEALWRKMPVYRMRQPADFLPLFRDKPMKFAPGERFDYNDGGFILLGLVVEQVAGTPFRTCVEQQVFAPAGMNDSGYFASDRLPARTARAYIQEEDGGWRTNVFAVPAVGGADGGAYTTAGDMQRFWQALIAGNLLKPDLRGAMFEPQTATGWKPPYTHYGLGMWMQYESDDRPLPRKRFVVGSDPGVAFSSMLYDEEPVVMTLLGNTGRALWPLRTRLEEALGLG